MNPDAPTPREQLEARVTALLLGELPADQAAELLGLMSQDAELAALHGRLARVIELVRETATDPVEQTAEQTPKPRLSEDRYQKLLAEFKTTRPKEFAQPKKPWNREWLVPVTAAAAIVLIVGTLAVPNYVRSRATSTETAIINNLRQIDGAKQQWAIEHKVTSSDSTPTMSDLMPYLGRGTGGQWPESVNGEKYVIGNLSKSPTAENAKRTQRWNEDGRLPAVIVQTYGHGMDDSAAVALAPRLARKLPERAAAAASTNHTGGVDSVFSVNVVGYVNLTNGPVVAGAATPVFSSHDSIVLPSITEPPGSVTPPSFGIAGGTHGYDESRTGGNGAGQKGVLGAFFDDSKTTWDGKLLVDGSTPSAGGNIVLPPATEVAEANNGWQSGVNKEPSLFRQTTGDSQMAVQFKDGNTKDDVGGMRYAFTNGLVNGGPPAGQQSATANWSSYLGGVRATVSDGGVVNYGDVTGLAFQPANEGPKNLGGGYQFSSITNYYAFNDAFVDSFDFHQPSQTKTEPSREGTTFVTNNVNLGWGGGGGGFGGGGMGGSGEIFQDKQFAGVVSRLDQRDGVDVLTQADQSQAQARLKQYQELIAGGLPAQRSMEQVIDPATGLPTSQKYVALDGVAQKETAGEKGLFQNDGLMTNLVSEDFNPVRRDYLALDHSSQPSAGTPVIPTESAPNGPQITAGLRGRAAPAKGAASLMTPTATAPSSGESFLPNLFSRKSTLAATAIPSSARANASSAVTAAPPVPTAATPAEVPYIAGTTFGSVTVDTGRKPAEQPKTPVLGDSSPKIPIYYAMPSQNLAFASDALSQQENLSGNNARGENRFTERFAYLDVNGKPDQTAGVGEVRTFVNNGRLVTDNDSELHRMQPVQQNAAGDREGKQGDLRRQPSTNVSSTRDYPNSTMMGPVSVSVDPRTGELIVITDDKTFQSVTNTIRGVDQPTGTVAASTPTNLPNVKLTGLNIIGGGTAKQVEDLAEKRTPAPPLIPQPEVLVRENAFSTFSLNVSDVAFKLAAASLEKGVMPDPGTMRSEEFINAFDYRDPEPPPGARIGFAWERARDPFAHNRDLLRFAVKTAAVGRPPGQAMNIVLLLDNSGSMERADRVAIIREALRVLAAQLGPQDRLSVVTFARTARLWVDGISGSEAAAILKKISELTPEGGTNLEEAMRLAYETALRHYLAGGLNRVVLLTDGAANLGNVDPAMLKQEVELHRKQGVALDCFGIGWEGYNDDLLEVLSRNGDGRYGFINTPEEAATGFAGQLAGAFNVAASDVKVQVEFNQKRATAYRQIGYARHQLTKEQFRDNTVNAAQIAAAESGNALYTVEVNPQGEGPVCTVRVRYRLPGTQDYREQAWDVPYNGAAPALEQASPAMRLAGTSAAFAEWLGNSPFAAEVTTDRLLACLNGVPEVYGADARPRKLEAMIRQAKSITGR